MSLWVKLHTTFYTHRKTARLKCKLGQDAFWIVPRLWTYCAEQHPDGLLSDYTPDELATAIGYTGNASSMLQALIDSGFLDTDPLRIHDWTEHNGYHEVYAKRAKAAAQARWQKERTKEKGEEQRGEEKSKHTSSMPQASEAKPSRPPADWQLSKDRERLKTQIREVAESTCPDQELLAGLRAQLKQVNDQIRALGNAQPATPRSKPQGETTPPERKFVPMSPEQLEKWRKGIDEEIANSKP